MYVLLGRDHHFREPVFSGVSQVGVFLHGISPSSTRIPTCLLLPMPQIPLARQTKSSAGGWSPSSGSRCCHWTGGWGARDLLICWAPARPFFRCRFMVGFAGFCLFLLGERCLYTLAEQKESPKPINFQRTPHMEPRLRF